MDNKFKILSVLEEALKLKILKLSKELESTDETIKAELETVLNDFSEMGHIKDSRVNVFNMIYECNQLPNRISVDVWTKYDKIESKPITFNFKMNYEL